jgi:hypothetical protein
LDVQEIKLVMPILCVRGWARVASYSTTSIFIMNYLLDLEDGTKKNMIMEVELQLSETFVL